MSYSRLRWVCAPRVLCLTKNIICIKFNQNKNQKKRGVMTTYVDVMRYWSNWVRNNTPNNYSKMYLIGLAYLETIVDGLVKSLEHGAD